MLQAGRTVGVRVQKNMGWFGRLWMLDVTAVEKKSGEVGGTNFKQV